MSAASRGFDTGPDNLGVPSVDYALLRRQHIIEKAAGVFLMACAIVSVLTTIGIVAVLLTEAIRFFNTESVTGFLFGTRWTALFRNCLLYTSDAADDLLCVDLGGRR